MGFANVLYSPPFVIHLHTFGELFRSVKGPGLSLRLSPKMSQVIYFAEDEPGRKWDKCVTDALLKTGSGAFIGYVYSLLFYSAKCRRRWPVVLGAAFGFGMAYGNCERALNNAILPQDKLLQQKKAC